MKKPSTTDAKRAPADDKPANGKTEKAKKLSKPGEPDGRGPQVSVVKFSPGSVVATPGVLDAFRASGDDPLAYLVRHTAGDWGELDEHDRKENELSLEQGWRLLSAYTLSNGVRFWIITEADRSSTTFLLPDEY